jgi:hypothetical protein
MPTAWKVATALIRLVIAGALAMWMRSLHYSLLAWLSGAVAAYFALTLIAQACAAFVLWRNAGSDGEPRVDGEL